MREFPTELLIPKVAWLWGATGAASMEIELELFSLPHMNEPIETSISLEYIELPTIVPAELEGQTFLFPTNPDQGYIEGSIYIEHAHHPVDVTSISFGRSNGGQLEVTISMKIVFDFEGLDDFSATDWECLSRLVVESV